MVMCMRVVRVVFFTSSSALLLLVSNVGATLYISRILSYKKFNIKSMN